MQLNDFHTLNRRRMYEAFPPAHDTSALLVCVGEEVGELCGAILGVTGEKKRKAYMTTVDVLDACADAATYLSLVLSSLGHLDLVAVLSREREGVSVISPPNMQLATLRVQEMLGGAIFSFRIGNHESSSAYAARCFLALGDIARYFGCLDWSRLLGETFNMVSDRAGSSIKVTL